MTYRRARSNIIVRTAHLLRRLKNSSHTAHRQLQGLRARPASDNKDAEGARVKELEIYLAQSAHMLNVRAMETCRPSGRRLTALPGPFHRMSSGSSRTALPTFSLAAHTLAASSRSASLVSLSRRVPARISRPSRPMCRAFLVSSHRRPLPMARRLRRASSGRRR